MSRSTRTRARQRLFIVASSLAAWTTCMVSASADTLVLVDGSQIQGVVKLLAGGKLTFSTDFAGELEIDLAKVQAIRTDDARQIQTADGQTRLGVLAADASGLGSVIRVGDDGVPLVISDLHSIWQDGAKSPEEIELEQALALQRGIWKAHVEASATLKEGNTDSLNALVRFDLTRVTDVDSLKFYGSYQYAEQDDVRNSNETIGGALYERNLSDFLNWYARFELENDEFEDLELRTTVATGLGLKWIEKDKLELKNRVGIGYIHESFSDGSTDDTVAADVGLDFRWDINDWLRVTHNATYLQGLERLEDYLLTFDSALVIPVANNDWLSFKIGMLNKYNNQPAPGRDRLDNTYYGALSIDIE